MRRQEFCAPGDPPPQRYATAHHDSSPRREERSTYGADGIGQIRIAENEPTTRSYSVRLIVELMRPHLIEITKP